MPLSAVDVISPAFERMRQQLFRPFQLGQWVRLAIVGFLAGEMGSGGGIGGQFPSVPSSQQGPVLQGMRLPFGGGLLLILAIAVLVLLAVVLGIVLLYVACRMRFVLFDSVLAGRCRIREFWGRRGEVAFRYFVWQLLFLLCIVMAMILLFGITFGFVFGMGWFSSPRNHLLPLVLVAILGFLIFLASLLVIGVVQVLVKDFVVPQMIFENVSVGEGWRRLLSMMKAEKGGYAGYIGMKIVLSFAAAMVLFFAFITVFLVLLIPVGGVGAITVLGGRAAGLTWNPLTIAVAIVVGGIAVIALILIAALISVPAIVFFPAYSIHFFAERYPALHAALNPPPSNSDIGTVPT
jgi:hypothetical protein